MIKERRPLDMLMTNKTLTEINDAYVDRLD
jgi:hypothetical protein